MAPLAEAYLQRSTWTQELRDIRKALDYTRDLLIVTRNNDSRVRGLYNLGRCRQRLFDESKDVEELKRAVRAFKRAEDEWTNNTEDEGMLPRIRRGRAESYVALSMATGSKLYFDSALMIAEGTVQLYPENGESLCTLAYTILHPWNSESEVEYVRIIELLSRVLQAIPPKDSCRYEALSWYARVQRLHFQFHGNPEDLDLAVATSEDVLDLESWTCFPKLVAMREYAICLGRRHMNRQVFRHQHSEDLKKGIELSDTIERLVPPGDTDHFEQLSNYGYLLGQRYEAARNPADLEQAIHYTQRAIHQAVRHDEAYSAALFHCAECLCMRYFESGNVEHLREGLKEMDKAIHTVPIHARDKVRFQLLQSYYLIMLSSNGIGVLSLYKAIAVITDSLEFTPKHDGDKARRLCYLSFTDRFDYRGSDDDFERSVFFMMDAIQITHQDCPMRSEYLSKLISKLTNRALKKKKLLQVELGSCFAEMRETFGCLRELSRKEHLSSDLLRTLLVQSMGHAGNCTRFRSSYQSLERGNGCL